MQHRYTGDIGDFGKFLLLKTFFDDLTIGTIWYLYPDEVHNNDGRHTVCESNATLFSRCREADPRMTEQFNALFRHPNRHVGLLEQARLIRNGIYFSDPILANDPNDPLYRKRWHQKALEHIAASRCQVVCLDPDNGILPKSRTKASPMACGKYATYEEIETFFQIDCVRHCIVYQHPHRMKSHLEQAKALKETFETLYENRATVTLIRHNPVQARFYIILSKETPHFITEEALSSMTYGGKAFFSLISD